MLITISLTMKSSATYNLSIPKMFEMIIHYLSWNLKILKRKYIQCITVRKPTQYTPREERIHQQTGSFNKV